MPASRSWEEKTTATPRRILVGVDHSDEAAAGLRRAAAIAGTARAELTVVHVAVPPPTWAGLGMLALPLIEDVVEAGAELVRRSVAELPAELCVRWHVVTGADAACGTFRHQCVRRALRRALEDDGHDLLVLGTGTSPGRIARRLLRLFPQRVLTAPYADQPAAGWSAPKMLPSVSWK